jgi:hypothetical protein
MLYVIDAVAFAEGNLISYQVGWESVARAHVDSESETYRSVCENMKIHINLNTTRLFSGLAGHVRESGDYKF